MVRIPTRRAKFREDTVKLLLRYRDFCDFNTVAAAVILAFQRFKILQVFPL